MSRRLWQIGIAAVAGLLAAIAGAETADRTAAGEGPGLGRPVGDADIHNITVFANGDGLPSGAGTVPQGQQLYVQYCLACHGTQGRGGNNDALAGGAGGGDGIDGVDGVDRKQPGQRTIGSFWPYAPTLYDYVRRAMPYQNPGQLSAQQTYSIVAYLLFLNGLWAEQEVMDAAGLLQVKMPNRKNFTSEYELP